MGGRVGTGYKKKRNVAMNERREGSAWSKNSRPDCDERVENVG